MVVGRNENINTTPNTISAPIATSHNHHRECRITVCVIPPVFHIFCDGETGGGVGRGRVRTGAILRMERSATPVAADGADGAADGVVAGREIVSFCNADLPAETDVGAVTFDTFAVTFAGGSMSSK